jgi:hypothetical protein
VANTIGVIEVAALAAMAAGVLPALQSRAHCDGQVPPRTKCGAANSLQRQASLRFIGGLSTEDASR